VAELADAADSKSAGALLRVGSTPSSGTSSTSVALADDFRKEQKEQMDTSNLIGHKVEIKTESLNVVLSAVILGVDTVGVWIGKGDAVAKITSSFEGLIDGFIEPAVFLPFSKISWMLTETKEAVYQKSR
jgi:hypothetical protein